MPPTISLEQVTGFSLFMLKAVLSGRGDEVVDLDEGQPLPLVKYRWSLGRRALRAPRFALLRKSRVGAATPPRALVTQSVGTRRAKGDADDRALGWTQHEVQHVEARDQSSWVSLDPRYSRTCGRRGPGLEGGGRGARQIRSVASRRCLPDSALSDSAGPSTPTTGYSPYYAPAYWYYCPSYGRITRT